MTAWLPRYRYRLKLTVTSNTTAQTDYPVMYKIYTIAGANSGSAIYLSGDVQSDLKDIRFTTSDGITPCNYWIEHPAITNGFNVWVKCPTIATTPGTTIYLYYGASGVASASNGDKTFSFFDDFEGSTLGTGKWTGSTGTFTVSNSEVAITHTTNGAFRYSIPTFGQNYSTITRGKWGSGDSPLYGFRSIADNYFAVFYHGWQTGSKLNINTGTNTGTYGNAIFTDATWSNYHIFEMIRNGSTSAIGIVDRSDTQTITTYLPSGSLPAVIGRDGITGQTVTVDWVLVRPYTSTEPTLASSTLEVTPTIARQVRGMS